MMKKLIPSFAIPLLGLCTLLILCVSFTTTPSYPSLEDIIDNDCLDDHPEDLCAVVEFEKPDGFRVTLSQVNKMSSASSTTLMVQIASPTNVRCFGNSDGTAMAAASGGTSPYTYVWSNGITGANNMSLAAGTFTVTVTDATTCTAIASGTLTQPSALMAVTVSQTNITCASPTGSATISASGGTPAYTYSWPSGGSSATETNLSAGSHVATVTDANSCMETVAVVITSDVTPPIADAGPDMTLHCLSTSVVLSGINSSTSSVTYQWSTSGGNIVSGATTTTPTVNAAGTYTLVVTDQNNSCTASDIAVVTEIPDPSVSGVVTNVSCYQGSDGSIDLTITGGLPNYTIDWSDNTYDGIEDPTGLPAGSFGVTVTDANGCVASETYIVTQPASTTLSASVTDATCGLCNGSINLTVSGGTPAYTYAWSNGASTEDLSGLCGGTYTVTVTDNNGCTSELSRTVNAGSGVATTSNVTDATCGLCNGSIDLMVSGGTPAYTYLWSNGGTTEDLSNLCAGTYTVTVTDSGGCTSEHTQTVNATSSISTTSSATDATCGLCNGSIDLMVSGGTPAYTYTWSTGAATEDLSNLCAGTYTVTVTDSNGCTSAHTQMVNEAAALTASISVTDAICAGICDGEIDLTVSGGNTPYTFDWNVNSYDGVEDPVGLCAGNYTVTVTDADGCTVVATGIVNEPPAMQISNTVTDVDCNGQCNGTIDVVVMGGTMPYAYNWNIVAWDGASSATGVCAGTYTITVTDDNGCTVTSTMTVSEPNPITGSAMTTDVNCANTCDGTVIITASGGTHPYTFSLNGGVPGVDSLFTGLCPGVYSSTITDANGCMEVVDFTINEPTALTGTAAITPVTCNGACDGSIIVTANGGTPPYNYDIGSGPSPNSTITGLCAGSYTVIIRDANNCELTLLLITITEPTPLVANATATGVTSAGANDGTASANPTGGTPSYTYLWSNAGITQTITGLSPGNYTVTVTDSNGCTSSESVTVNDFNCSIAATIVSQNPNCGGSDGEATAVVSGSTGAVSYNWSNMATTATISGLASGTYTVTVTDADNCSATASVTLTDPPELMLSVSSTPQTMMGANDGTATATVSGGAGGYTYIWSNSLIGATITNLAPGTYCVTVTDLNGCTAEGCTTVNAVDCSGFSASISTTDVLCNGGNDGTATANPMGGTTPFTYAWSGNNGNTATITGLSSGTYGVTITDGMGCVASDSVFISQPSALSLVLTATDETAPGANDGTATANVSGGTAPYVYTWSSAQTTSSISGLAPGVYCVTITDANNCTAEGCVDVGASSCSGFSVTVAVTNPNCNAGGDGSATATPMGGMGPYAYDWSGINSGEATVNGLSAGTYTVTVTDANDCTATATFMITAPPALNLMVNATDETTAGADDGTAVAIVSGGTPNYTYQWSNGEVADSIIGLAPGTYCVTVTDDNGCTVEGCVEVGSGSCSGFSATVTTVDVSCNGGSDGSATATPIGGTGPYAYDWAGINSGEAMVNGLSAGSYTVTVTDANNCTAIENFTINEPTPIDLGIQVNRDSVCSGECDGQVILMPSGGTPGYNFIWSDGFSGQNRDDLCAGTYMVTVTDSNGCTAVGTVSIVETSALVLTTASTNETALAANDGTATVSVAGGVAPYSYLWSNLSTTQSISGLPPGTYCVTVTDNNGCTAEACTTVNPFGCNLLLAISSDNLTCPDFCNGSITLTVNGGITPYTYTWNDLGLGNTPNPDGLCAGTYTVTITDATGCSGVATTSVEVADDIIVDYTTTTETCPGACDGTFEFAISGGVPPYTTSTTATDLNALCAGNYELIVTDALGCVDSIPFTIDELPAITVVIDTIGAEDLGSENGFINITVTGGFPPYTYSWEFEGNVVSLVEDPSGLMGGTYILTVTDVNGCTYTETIVVPIITATNDISAYGSFQLFPNPTQGQLFLDFDFNQSTSISISLFDMTGRRLSEERYEKIKQRKLALQLNELPQGIYTLFIEGEGFQHFEKIVLVK